MKPRKLTEIAGTLPMPNKTKCPIRDRGMGVLSGRQILCGDKRCAGAIKTESCSFEAFRESHKACFGKGACECPIFTEFKSVVFGGLCLWVCQKVLIVALAGANEQ